MSYHADDVMTLSDPATTLFKSLIKSAYNQPFFSEEDRSKGYAARLHIKENCEAFPSIKSRFFNPFWVDIIWVRAIAELFRENTAKLEYPEKCPWLNGEFLDDDFWG